MHGNPFSSIRARAVSRAAACGSLALLLAAGCSTGDAPAAAGSDDTPKRPVVESATKRKTRTQEFTPHSSNGKLPVKNQPPVARPKGAANSPHPLPPELMNTLVEHVARETGVEPAEVALTKAEEVTWRDGSLGCPEPGMAYSQALIEGYWVILSAGGETYDFSVTQGGQFSRCTNRKAPAPIRNSDL